MSSLSERDQQVIWHPYTQMKLSSPPVGITRGEGVYLIDDAGNKYIDAVSSWWVNIHGHAHPYRTFNDSSYSSFGNFMFFFQEIWMPR